MHSPCTKLFLYTGFFHLHRGEVGTHSILILDEEMVACVIIKFLESVGNSEGLGIGLLWTPLSALWPDTWEGEPMQGSMACW